MKRGGKLKKGDKKLSTRVALKTTKKLEATRHPISGTSKRVRDYNDEFAFIRPIILERDQYQCRIRYLAPFPCGFFGDGLHVHHRLPRSLGGDNSQNNLITLCPTHHTFVHNDKWGKENGFLLTPEPKDATLIA